MKDNKIRTILKTMICVSAMSGLAACGQSDIEVQPNKPELQSMVSGFDYTSDWLNIRVINSGKANAPNLILIPGLVSSSQVWHGVVPELGKTHNLHIADISGFAGTSATPSLGQGIVDGLVADLASYIKTKDLHDVTIMGHSMGGFTALNEALQHANLLDKIIIVDSLPFFPAIFNPAANVEMMQGQAQGMSNMITSASESEFKTMQTQGIMRLSKNADARREILSWSLSSDRATMARAMLELMTSDRRSDLAKITTEVHVIYAWDAVMGMPAKNMDQLYASQYKGLRNLHLTRIDDSYHFIMKDQPAAFLTAVNSALNTQ